MAIGAVEALGMPTSVDAPRPAPSRRCSPRTEARSSTVSRCWFCAALHAHEPLPVRSVPALDARLLGRRAEPACRRRPGCRSCAAGCVAARRSHQRVALPAGHYYFICATRRVAPLCVVSRQRLQLAGHAGQRPGAGRARRSSLLRAPGTCELVADLLFPEGVGLAQMHGRRCIAASKPKACSTSQPQARAARRCRGASASSRPTRAPSSTTCSACSERRFPLAEVIFVPDPVQGAGRRAGHGARPRSPGRLAARRPRRRRHRRSLAAAARTTTWPPSTTSAWCAPSSPARCPSSPLSATRPI